MRILFLALDVDLDIQRGESVHVSELARNLVQLGHEVRLVTASGKESDDSRVVNVRRDGSTLRQIFQARGLARDWADVIYERRFSPKVSWSVSRLVRVPFVLEVNGIVGEERRGASSSEPYDSRVKSRLRAKMIRDASRIVAVSRDIADTLVRIYNVESDLVLVVPNGANPDLFRPLSQRECRTHLGIPLDVPIVCFAGNLAFWQGLDILLQATGRLLEEFPSLQVRFVGSGPEGPSLSRMAAELGLGDALILVGAVNYEDVPLHIGAADVCVAPFRASRKASPIKVFEYLACGKPVVASNINEIGEFLSSHRAGLAVPPEDPTALSEALRSLLSEPETAARMGLVGRELVLASRTWHETAVRVAQVLETVVRKRSA